MREYRYFEPAGFDELFAVVSAQADAEVKFLAGGTDLVPRINLAREQVPTGAEKPMAIVSLAKLGMSGICDEGEKIVIGATTPIVEIQNSELLRSRVPALCQAADVLASYAVRNVATLAGNIMNASPAADTVPALVVLDGEVTLRSAGGERTVKVVDFMVGPGKTAIADGEVVTAITLYPGKGGCAFQKLGRRKAETLSTVNAAAYVEAEDGVCKAIRVAVGSVAPTVVKCTAVEEALLGKELTEENISAAAAKAVEMIAPIDDIRASAWYRNKITPVMIKRAIVGSIG